MTKILYVCSHTLDHLDGLLACDWAKRHGLIKCTPNIGYITKCSDSYLNTDYIIKLIGKPIRVGGAVQHAINHLNNDGTLFVFYKKTDKNGGITHIIRNVDDLSVFTIRIGLRGVKKEHALPFKYSKLMSCPFMFDVSPLEWSDKPCSGLLLERLYNNEENESFRHKLSLGERFHMIKITLVFGILVVCQKLKALWIARIFGIKMPTVYRLGNELDLWLSGNPNSRLHRLLFMSNSRKSGFVKYLREQKCELPKQSIPLIDGHCHMLMKYEHFEHRIKELHFDLNYHLHAFMGKKKVLYTKDQCVVHVRTGDFLKDYRMGVLFLTTHHITNSVREFNPTSILLLDGGKQHMDTSSTTLIDTQRYADLFEELSKIAPVQRSHQGADEDFYTMSLADYLVTGQGTFAISAAISNEKGQVRTPGLSLLGFTNGTEDMQPVEKQLTDRWRTYKCMY